MTKRLMAVLLVVASSFLAADAPKKEKMMSEKKQIVAERISDAEKNNSTQMNATQAEAAVQNAGGLRVVFIGNSITLHAVAPGIGWNHNWGMAASAEEKDYVHIVTRGIEEKTGRKADVRVRNLARFERGFASYDFALEQDLVDFAPDYLIVALGENVGALATQEEQLAFSEAFKKLLEGFLKGPKKPKTVVRGVFWPRVWKDEMMSRAAKELDVTFVKADLSKDKSMMALGLFEHSGVAHHPGDKGMEAIARLILKALFPDEAEKE
ncbi:MAG: SGNH/GDSL hydrolase family protein [Victivallales bacterium]|nr:SGNH/GDSL hydrolase family protein [Victivallales bacterium]